MSTLEDLYSELTSHDYVHPYAHVHQSTAQVNGDLIHQDIYICLARRFTTYNLRVMQEFQDALEGCEGLESTRSFRLQKPYLSFGELARTTQGEATIRSLLQMGVSVTFRGKLDDRRSRLFEQRTFVRLMPCKRLLSRHDDSIEKPPAMTGDHSVDKFIAKHVIR